MLTLSNLATKFRELFGQTPRIFSAPGRVNLIGEHTDYNEGFVLPIAIDRRTYVAAAARRDNRVHIEALDLDDSAQFDLQRPQGQPEKKWLAYVAGIAWMIERQQRSLLGADLMISSDVPIGGGLSSSAALEIAAGKAFTALSKIELAPLSLALLAQEAENTFAGARVGNMDQLSATFGKRDCALLIDCRSLQLREIPINKTSAAIVVCNTNVKHELASSAYNERRDECERAVEILKQRLPAISSLRDVSLVDFQRCEADLPEPLRRRARHVVTENARTLEAADAFQRGDLRELGRLMKLSHQSLRDDYEVSSRELNLMVELAWSDELVYGARMTGGGFGGCTVNLVAPEGVDRFIALIGDRYQAETGIDPDAFVVAADDGAREELSQEIDV